MISCKVEVALPPNTLPVDIVPGPLCSLAIYEEAGGYGFYRLGDSPTVRIIPAATPRTLVDARVVALRYMRAGAIERLKQIETWIAETA